VDKSVSAKNRFLLENIQISLKYKFISKKMFAITFYKLVLGFRGKTKTTFCISFWRRLECVGHFFAYVAHFVFLKDA
jgi:hypothetical protein